MIALAVLLSICGAVERAAAQSLTITRTNQDMVLSWFGDDGVAYQLESSPDLRTWTNLGAAMAGTGNYINVMQPMGAQSRAFFRLKLLGVLSAVFNPGTGVLTITGDALDNTFVVSRDGAGNLRINGGAVMITGGVPTVGNTTMIRILGGAGADQISLDETNGALPAAELLRRRRQRHVDRRLGQRRAHWRPGRRCPARERRRRHAAGRR